MKKLFSIAIILSTVILSCKKDKKEDPKPTPQPDVVYANYAHLKTGSYWIYQIFEVDSDGNSTATSSYDSIYAGPEKEINGKVYQSRMVPDGSVYTPLYSRDSFTYRVTDKGTVIFSYTDFKTIFKTKYLTDVNDTIARVDFQMTDKGYKMSVPAGTFETHAYTETWDLYPPYASNGVTRKLCTRYNSDFGIVSETLPFYIDNPKMMERRLVRYKLVK